jgi:DHA2 family multidrug resistance protein
MPNMIGTFGVSLDVITWVAVAYSIAEILVVMMAAWFSTLLGRQRFYTVSLAVFTAASVFCGFARSLEMMLIGRVLQGFSGGGLIPLSRWSAGSSGWRSLLSTCGCSKTCPLPEA